MSARNFYGERIESDSRLFWRNCAQSEQGGANKLNGGSKSGKQLIDDYLVKEVILSELEV